MSGGCARYIYHVRAVAAKFPGLMIYNRAAQAVIQPTTSPDVTSPLRGTVSIMGGWRLQNTVTHRHRPGHHESGDASPAAIKLESAARATCGPRTARGNEPITIGDWVDLVYAASKFIYTSFTIWPFLMPNMVYIYPI